MSQARHSRRAGGCAGACGCAGCRARVDGRVRAFATLRAAKRDVSRRRSRPLGCRHLFDAHAPAKRDDFGWCLRTENVVDIPTHMRPLCASLEACGRRPGKPWRLFARLNAVTPRNHVKRPPRIYVARAKPAFCAPSAPMRAGLCARVS